MLILLLPDLLERPNREAALQSVLHHWRCSNSQLPFHSQGWVVRGRDLWGSTGLVVGGEKERRRELAQESMGINVSSDRIARQYISVLLLSGFIWCQQQCQGESEGSNWEGLRLQYLCSWHWHHHFSFVWPLSHHCHLDTGKEAPCSKTLWKSADTVTDTWSKLWCLNSLLYWPCDCNSQNIFLLLGLPRQPEEPYILCWWHHQGFSVQEDRIWPHQRTSRFQGWNWRYKVSH